MKIDFTGQVVMITGATRGIGKQIADDIEKLGARLILTGTRQDQIDMLNKNVEGVKKKYLCVNFTDRKGTEKTYG